MGVKALETDDLIKELNSDTSKDIDDDVHISYSDWSDWRKDKGHKGECAYGLGELKNLPQKAINPLINALNNDCDINK